jgi:carbonic anhydrase/acetyltransferase-like protein (isoleucine patch superfamily)
MQYPLKNGSPNIADDAFIAESADLMGAITIHSQASIWFGAVLRGDTEPIVIGPQSNIQDGSVLHTDPGFPLSIGQGVTVGHKAVLHGCTIDDYSLVGIGAIILNGVKIGKHCLIGAGTLITENKTIPDGSLVIGSPGSVHRLLNDQEITALHHNAKIYITRASDYLKALNPD